MIKIHWLGAGLSSIPGLRSLIKEGYPVVTWDRDLPKAEKALEGLDADIRFFGIDDFSSTLEKGDIVVSMFSVDWHNRIARLCLEQEVHFASASYITPQIRIFEDEAQKKGLCLVNEVGLDPGIDHLMAHWLVHNYRHSLGYHTENKISFISYCGGISKLPNSFRYKFSWSPLGVFKALHSPSKSIKNGKVIETKRPWEALFHYTAPLPNPEIFEIYPNRDSLPFIQEYNFLTEWKIDEFIRGTLRLEGWANAWKDIFTEMKTLEGEAGEKRLQEMSEQFGQKNSFEVGEPDRVVLCVGLKAERNGENVYDKTYVLDAWGDERGSAMARLVSGTLALTIKSLLEGQINPGISTTPSQPEIIASWMKQIQTLCQHLQIVDTLQKP